jgi:hypothetical protein
MFATESIASFFPQAPLRHPQTSRVNRVRMHLAPSAMGTRAPRDTARLAGVGLLVRLRIGVMESFRPFVSFAPNVRTQVPENKNRAADVPAELRQALHRRLPSRRKASSEPG